MDLTPRRRRAISTALAVLLALESVTAVGAAARTSINQPVGHALPAASPHGVVLAESSAGEPAAVAPQAGLHDSDVPVPIDEATRVPSVPGVVPTVPAVPGVVPAEPGDVREDGATPSAAARTARAAMPARTARRATSSPASSKAAPARTVRTATYRGRNHVWIPSLGISRPISLFPCERSRPPDNLVYRWGCAGANNLYLMGHAYSVIKPLHDAYVSGRLRVGMKAVYADAKGRVHVYAVKWWKVTRPTPSASWAWAAQGRPSMTLQTCVGANSAYRLVVRLVGSEGSGRVVLPARAPVSGGPTRPRRRWQPPAASHPRRSW